MTNLLELVLMLLAAAVVVVILFRSIHQPPMLGYLLVGVVLGPHAAGLIPNVQATRSLAEFGVVFLMFSIGLEFSLPRLRQMRRIVFGLGLAQVVVTVALAMLGAAVLGMGWRTGLVLGGALAMSSTAIVGKMLAERMEVESAHGRDMIGVLLFQDLAVVPLLVIIPALSAPMADLAGALLIAALKAAAVLTILLVGGQKLMRTWFLLIARRRSHELFVLNVLLITLGLAYLTERAGLSLALGAFVAGMLIAETEFRHQVEDDIKPFRDVLLGLFFISIGMLLDVSVVISQFPLVLLLLMGPLIAKFGLIALLARLNGATPGNALRVGLGLAQAGEFGFVLLAQAGGLNFVDSELMQAILAAMLISMLLAPSLIQSSDRIVLRFTSSEWMLRSMQVTKIAAQALDTDRHVIVCGYGHIGQHLARLLAEEGIGYVALDLDPEHVSEAAAAGERVVYGDAARRESLIAAGVARAAAVVVAYADPASALRVLAQVHALNPGLPVIVRTRDDAELDRLIAAGAAEVVPETLESGLMLASHALIMVGVPVQRVVRTIRSIRAQRYRLLRGFFHGASDDAEDLDDAAQPRLHSVTLSSGAKAVNRTLGEIGLKELDIEVRALRRAPAGRIEPLPDIQLEEGDVLVLLGVTAKLALAEARLL
jgi:monovalent cation:H+ antiporter-2, CPA2 family